MFFSHATVFLIVTLISTFNLGQCIENCNGGNNKDKITSLPGLSGDLKQKQYSGYINVNSTTNGSLFYWFFESQQKDADERTPLLVWLNGGPGASSMTGLFYENGPYRLNNDLTLNEWNYTWNIYYHMLFVDNPIGTGFSFVSNKNGYVTTIDELGMQFVKFLNGFYTCHPEYSTNPLYITGESYAGKYIPFIAKWILKNNNETLKTSQTSKTLKTNTIPLKGLAIGNGQYNPYVQMLAGPEYAHSWGILDANEYNNVTTIVTGCLNMATTGVNSNNKTMINQASDICVNITNNIYGNSTGDRFQYNVLYLDQMVFNEQTVALTSYLSKKDVKEAIHTVGIDFMSSDGTSSPNPVYNALRYDVMLNNSANIFPMLIENNIPILFYNGQLDGSIWGNLGNSRCLDEWNYKGNWVVLEKTVWKGNLFANGDVSGYVKKSDDKMLTYFVVVNSGHLVPFDQPMSALDMIYTWLNDQF